MKAYTDLDQSKKLAEILPIESADMHYCLEQRDVATGYEIGTTPFIKAKRFEGKCNIVNVQPAWSLAALLYVLPSFTLDSSNDHYYMLHCMGQITGRHENPIDACYEMIIKLHEQRIL